MEPYTCWFYVKNGEIKSFNHQLAGDELARANDEGWSRIHEDPTTYSIDPNIPWPEEVEAALGLPEVARAEKGRGHPARSPGRRIPLRDLKDAPGDVEDDETPGG